MSALYGVEYLRKKLAQKRSRVDLRYSHYEMKHKARDFNISTPPKLQYMMGALGWCAKAVDSVADRIKFYEMSKDNLNMNEIFRLNNPDVFFDSAILSALITACSFVYIYDDENGLPQLQVIDGGNATGVVDTITGMLIEGYAILDTDQDGNVTKEAYFTSDETTYYIKGEEPYTIDNPTNYPLLVPIIYRPDARRPFGHSRISRACMDIVDQACRCVKRTEISAEFYSFPQKWVTGLSEDAEMIDKWRASMSAMMMFTQDENGESPKVGQFTQMSMQPHIEEYRMHAAQFAGETGLTLDDLGIPTDNPSSAEAIKSAHENLRLTARKAQRTFGSGFVNVGYLAASLRDKQPYLRNRVYETVPVFEPLFEPDFAMLSSMGDGIIKINNAVPGYFNYDNLRVMTGIEKSEMKVENNG